MIAFKFFRDRAEIGPDIFEFSGSARCNPCNSDGDGTRPIVTGNGGQIVCVTSALSCICCLSVRTCIVTTSSDFLTLLVKPNVVRFMFSFRVDLNSSFSFKFLVINVLSFVILYRTWFEL